jgi:hypothetical protein
LDPSLLRLCVRFLGSATGGAAGTWASVVVVRGSAAGSEVGVDDVDDVFGFGTGGKDEDVVGARERKPVGIGMCTREDILKEVWPSCVEV